MSAMDTMKSLMKKSEMSDSLTSDDRELGRRGINSVIDAADKHVRLTDEIEEAALSSELEEAIVSQLAEDIEASLQESMESEIDFTETVVEEKASKKAFVVNSKVSERILELKRKRSTITDMKKEIDESGRIMELLSSKSVQLSDYLSKTEHELGLLEEIEDKYDTLKQASEKLARDHRTLLAKLSEAQNQTQILQGQKIRDREALDEAQVTINRLTEQTHEQDSELQLRKIEMSKVKDKNLDVTEKYEVLVQDNNDLIAENRELKDRLSQLTEETANQEKSIAKMKMQYDALQKENQQTLIDMSDIQNRYTTLSSKFTETQSELEQAKYELASKVTSTEEKIRLKDVRILKLEKNIEVLTRKMSLAEDMLAEIGHDKSIADMKELIEKSKSKPQKKTAAKSSKSAESVRKLSVVGN
ncbi:MAG: hypothetical protein AAGF54_01220 [Pseudomonadota bacterium]